MTPEKRDKIREIVVRGATEGERRAALERLELGSVDALELAKPTAEIEQLRSARNCLALYSLGLTAHVLGATDWAWLFAAMLGWSIWSDLR